jgi:hypothetical protein
MCSMDMHAHDGALGASRKPCLVRIRGCAPLDVIAQPRRFMRTRTLVTICAVVLLTGCQSLDHVRTTDHRQVHDAVAIGSAYAAAESKMNGLGFRCSPGSGPFRTEAGASTSAPSHLWCEKQVALNIACAARTQAIVVPEGPTVAQVHVFTHDNCL